MSTDAAGRGRRGYRGIIFDLDGVIVDSEPLHEAAFREVFAQLGHGDDHGLDFSDYYGRSDLSVWQDFLRRHPRNESLDDLTERKQRCFLAMLRERRPVFPAVPAMIAQLGARRALAIASGSVHAVIEAALSFDGLRRHFRAVVSATDVPQGKPAPDIFLRAAGLLGIAPADCCVVEDSPSGVTAARRAGMDVIAITNSVEPALLGHATLVVSGYEQLLERLDAD